MSTGGADRAAFLEAMAELPAGVTALTTWDDDGVPVGATLSAVSSLSLEPQLVLVCLARSSSTCRALTPGRRFLLHILCDGQESVAHALATKRADKFAAVAWRPGLGGLPQIEGSASVLACRVDGLHGGGDHLIVIGAVEAVEPGTGTPLVYHRRALVRSPVPASLPLEEAPTCLLT